MSITVYVGKQLANEIGASSEAWSTMKSLGIAPQPDFSKPNLSVWFDTPELQAWIDAIKAYKASGKLLIDYRQYEGKPSTAKVYTGIELRDAIGISATSWSTINAMRIVPDPSFKTKTTSFWFDTPELQAWIDDIGMHKWYGADWVTFPVYNTYLETYIL